MSVFLTLRQCWLDLLRQLHSPVHMLPSFFCDRPVAKLGDRPCVFAEFNTGTISVTNNMNYSYDIWEFSILPPKTKDCIVYDGNLFAISKLGSLN